MKSITITDPGILSYYNENPEIDIVTMNNIFIDILRKMPSQSITGNRNQFQEKLTNELSIFLNKYKHTSTIYEPSSLKQNTELYYLLQRVIGSDELISLSNDVAIINRMDTTKKSILFENKESVQVVTTEEVKKFERDVQRERKHGIFISQKTWITFKTDFQIDIINGLIHLYISEANYDTTKLRTAIDIVDSLSSKLEVIANASETTEKTYPFHKEDLDELAEDYRIFGLQKSSIIDMTKQMNKQLIDRLEEFQLPKIKKLLIKLGNIENDTEFKCVHCNIGGWKNKASLAAHARSCKNKEDSK
jgi:hypothetical protein